MPRYDNVLFSTAAPVAYVTLRAPDNYCAVIRSRTELNINNFRRFQACSCCKRPFARRRLAHVSFRSQVD